MRRVQKVRLNLISCHSPRRVATYRRDHLADEGQRRGHYKTRLMGTNRASRQQAEGTPLGPWVAYSLLGVSTGETFSERTPGGHASIALLAANFPNPDPP